MRVRFDFVTKNKTIYVENQIQTRKMSLENYSEHKEDSLNESVFIDERWSFANGVSGETWQVNFNDCLKTSVIK